MTAGRLFLHVFAPRSAQSWQRSLVFWVCRWAEESRCPETCGVLRSPVGAWTAHNTGRVVAHVRGRDFAIRGEYKRAEDRLQQDLGACTTRLRAIVFPARGGSICEVQR